MCHSGRDVGGGWCRGCVGERHFSKIVRCFVVVVVGGGGGCCSSSRIIVVDEYRI